MKIPINEIKVDREHRIRTDSGDLTALQNSIARVGLLNPVVVDEKHKLVAGFRRLSACRKLGWKEIEVRVVKLSGDPLLELDAEVDENLYRKDFTGEEIKRIAVRRRELERMLRGGFFQRLWRWLKSLFRPRKTSEKVRVQKSEAAIKPEKAG